MKFLLAIAFIFLACSDNYLTFSRENNIEVEEEEQLNAVKKDKTAKYDSLSKVALAYCKANNLHAEKYLLFDLGTHSGLKRLFIYNLKQNKIDTAFLVSHGSGKNPWGNDLSKENPEVSNVPDSHCSSVGKYIIGNRDVSQWGIKIKYWLHGKERTNNNAEKRVVVLHSWEDVTDEEVFPRGTVESWGCPAVSLSTMTYLDAFLKSYQNKMLMWVVK